MNKLYEEFEKKELFVRENLKPLISNIDSSVSNIYYYTRYDNHGNYDEYVDVLYKNGCKIIIPVHMCSLFVLTKRVIRGLKKRDEYEEELDGIEELKQIKEKISKKFFELDKYIDNIIKKHI